MGIIRFLLTITVVLVHAGLPDPIGGRLAVQIFFLISGYVIALVLNQPGRYGGVVDFYLGRVFKIYPEYVLVAVATAIFLPSITPAAPSYSSAVAAANVLIVGQDWLLFTANWNDGILVPQTWAIATEISFYVLAPFVVRHPSRLLFLFATSTTLRVVLIAHGVGMDDPWSHRFFPTELALFMVGALAFHSPRWLQISSVTAVAVSILVLLMAPVLIAHPLPRAAVELAVITVLLPSLTAFDADHPWSRKLGDACFPIFVVHVLALQTCKATLPEGISATWGLFVSVAAGVLLRLYVGIPLDSTRKKWPSSVRAAFQGATRNIARSVARTSR